MNTYKAKKQSKVKPFYSELITGSTKMFKPKKVKNKNIECDVTITPEKAKHILKHYNKYNRPAAANTVMKYCKDMMAGNWLETGATISFDIKGMLVDGQHRLLACVKSGHTQTFDVVYGLPEKAFGVIDNGKTRTNSEILSMMGYDNSSVLSAMVRSIISYQSTGNADAKKAQAFRGANQITKSQIIDYLQDHPELENYVERYAKGQIVSNSIASFCYWLLDNDPNATEGCAEDYLDQVLLGLNLKENTIETYLFNKLQRNRNALQNKMNKTSIIGNIILGWKRYMGYSQSKTLQINYRASAGLPNPYK